MWWWVLNSFILHPPPPHLSHLICLCFSQWFLSFPPNTSFVYKHTGFSIYRCTRTVFCSKVRHVPKDVTVFCFLVKVTSLSRGSLACRLHFQNSVLLHSRTLQHLRIDSRLLKSTALMSFVWLAFYSWFSNVRKSSWMHFPKQRAHSEHVSVSIQVKSHACLTEPLLRL